MKTKLLISTSLLAATLGFSSASAAQTTSYQMLIPFSANHPLNDAADLFIDLAEERFEERYQINLVGEEAIPGFEQFDPVSSCIFPLALASGAYHTGSTGVGLAADAIDADPKQRQDTGILDAYQAYYLTHNVRMISLPSANPGYHFMLKDPIGDDGGFEGRIMRGTLTYHGPIREFGASPSVMPVSEIYTAAERSAIDGAGHGILAITHWDFMKSYPT